MGDGSVLLPGHYALCAEGNRRGFMMPAFGKFAKYFRQVGFIRARAVLLRMSPPKVRRYEVKLVKQLQLKS